jgi:hypothetical protein
MRIRIPISFFGLSDKNKSENAGLKFSTCLELLGNQSHHKGWIFMLAGRERWTETIRIFK